MTTRKVAIQIISTGGVYGAERALLELATFLRDQNWDSRVLALEGRGSADLVASAVSRGLAAEAFTRDDRLSLLPMISKLRQIFKRYPGAIVHSHGYKPDILLSFLTPKQCAAVATCHNWISESPKMRALEYLDKRCVRRMERVIAVSENVRSQLLQSGVQPSQVCLVNNGIGSPAISTDARLRIRREFTIPAEAKLIVQIGRLARSKRNDLLIGTVASLREQLDIRVLLVGEGEQQAALMTLTEQKLLKDRVRFCGYRSDVGDILAAADLLVLTSEIEAMPIVILEAMAIGCPILSTRVGEIPQVLTDGVDAWLIPSGDQTALRSAIEDALANRTRAGERAQRARIRFQRCYSREIMGTKYLQIYDDLRRRRGWI